MKVMLATIALNEMEWLPRLIEQHKDWPGFVGWCIVEGADPIFRRTSPEMVSEDGLSVDGTTEFLERISEDKLNKICHLRAGNGFEFERGRPSDQHKCDLRNLYLSFFAPSVKPDVIVVLDADEFYARDAQIEINTEVEATFKSYDSWMFRQRHIWRPRVTYTCAAQMTVCEDDFEGQLVRGFRTQGKMYESPLLFSQEVVGGYWQVPHTRVWKYVPGMSHVRNHNWPEVDGKYLNRPGRMLRCDLMPGTPECVHLGYASSQEGRRAKHSYYVARGEGSEGGRIGRKRSTYLDCREAWGRWKPGDVLPHGAEVIEYTGPVPEVFR